MAEKIAPKRMPENYEVELALSIVSSMNISGMQVKDVHRAFLTCINEIRADQEALRKTGLWH